MSEGGSGEETAIGKGHQFAEGDTPLSKRRPVVGVLYCYKYLDSCYFTHLDNSQLLSDFLMS